MGLVRGRQAEVGVSIAVEDPTEVYGSDTGLSGYIGVPFIAEDLDLDRDQVADSEEISALSARLEVEPGRALAVGSITVRPRWEADWFNFLVACATGAEDRVVDKWMDGTAQDGATGKIATHIFTISDTLPPGLHIRAYISGPDGTGSIKYFKGAMVSKMTWEQNSSDPPKVTFEFLCKTMTVVAHPGNLPTPDGDVFAKLRDLARGDGTGDYDSIVQFRSDATNGFTDINLNNWTLEIDRSMEVNEAIMSQPDEIEKPGVTGQREIFLSMDGPYETTAAATRHPYHDYVNAVESGFHALYASATIIETGEPEKYGCRIHVPQLTWIEGDLPIADGNVLKWSVKGMAVLGATTKYPDGISGATDHAIPSGGADVRIITGCNDDDSGDQKWTTKVGQTFADA